MMFYCLSFARSAFLFKNFARSKKRLGTAALDGQKRDGPLWAVHILKNKPLL
jgi:hypothetical protein